MKPIIGITTGVRDDKFSIRPNYTRWINKCGGIPVMIPVDRNFNPKDYDYLDGLLLAGGSDVDPLLYGEEPERDLGVVVRVRDEGELALLDRMMGKPVLGICRGLQLMNVFTGGTLYQDIHTSEGSLAKLAHRPESNNDDDFIMHTVNIHHYTQLHDICGTTEIKVPSTHHQSIKNLGRGMGVYATSKDGVIEAAGIPSSSSFWLGVQWHPEKNPLNNIESTKLFTAFLDACQSKV